MVVFEAAFVTADLLFKMNESCIESAMDVAIDSFRFENHTGVQVSRAIRAEPGTFVRKHNAGLRAALEVFPDNKRQTLARALRQRLADI